MRYHTVVMYSRPQPDTIGALFLLRKFGEEKYPGVGESSVAFWTALPEGKTAEDLDREGYILLDLGGGAFDHHRFMENNRPTKCTTEIVAGELGVADDPALKMFLAWIRRDDLEGKGTISPDPLDRAFGLAALMMNLNRAYPDDLELVVNIGLHIYEAHYAEQNKRKNEVPEEWKKIKASGAARLWQAEQGRKNLRCALLQTNNPSLVGYLRAYQRVDVVLARLDSGHMNVVTRQERHVNLRGVIAEIRRREAEKSGTSVTGIDLAAQGRVTQAPEWFYDTASNTLQNGGMQPKGVAATRLSDDEFQEAVTKGLQMIP